MKLRLHHFLKCSYANGPGARAVIWVQGCPLHCPGCYNPDTHNFTGGTLLEVKKLADDLLALGNHIQGVTISGGEPLSQPLALSELLATLRSKSNLSVVLFTGYAWNEITTLPHLSPREAATGIPTFFRYVDVLIAGRYVQQQHVGSALRGSANKTIHFLSDRYSFFDFESTPTTEVVIESDGHIIQSGIKPTNLQLENTPNKRGSYA